MARFDELIAALEDLRRDVATFRRVVLHAHSPDSHDYDKTGRVGRDGDVAQYLRAVEAARLDMVAVTDHMKCDFACRLAKLAKSSEVCVLPAMEVSLRPAPPWSTFRLHVLAIFPEGYTVEKVCKVLPPDIPDERARTGREDVPAEDLRRFVKAIHDSGGLCVAAHVDTEQGLRRAFRQLGRDGITLCEPEGDVTSEQERRLSDDFKDWMLTAEFDAIEVGKPEHKEHYRWVSEVQGLVVSVPVLLTNDAHSPRDLAREERTTYVKMTTPSFGDLSQALRFPDTRIRFSNDVPKPPSPRILGLEVVAGDDRGFFKNLRVAFSDNLTCLIGPRGSGKSTIIEALRYVFGYNRTLDLIEDPGKDLAKKARSLQEATLTNCVIRVVYSGDDGEPHVLEAAYVPGEDYATRVYTVEGDQRDIRDVEASGVYPMRLFGWSEIETLGREPHRQRELLDRFVRDLSPSLDARRELRSRLADMRRNIEGLVSKLADIRGRRQGEISRYAEYKADFDQLNTNEAKALFAEIDTAQAKRAVLARLQTNLQAWLGALTDAAVADPLKGIDGLIAGEPKALQTWWSKRQREMNLADRLLDVRNEIGKAATSLRGLADELSTELAALDQEIQGKDEAIRDKVSEEVAGQVAAERRRTAKERLDRAVQLRREYNDEWGHLEKELQEWKQAAGRLVELHHAVTAKRATRKSEIEALLNQFATADMRISLGFGAGLDRRGFEHELREGGFLRRDLHGQYRQQRWPEKIAAVCTPVELAEAILGSDASRVTRAVSSDDGSIIEVDAEMARVLVDKMYPFARDEGADVPTVDGPTLARVLEIAEVEWDDVVGILLNDRPVEDLSPGQRSSAMLPLIALTETAPLIIDQPEDNLDNRLIGKMLVDILAGLKEKRQIIVATHNANIVVSGDAEQIVVLNVEGACKGVCEQSGSIDKPEIVDLVVDIMEGGKEAFLTRGRRYGLH